MDVFGDAYSEKFLSDSVATVAYREQPVVVVVVVAIAATGRALSM